MRIAVVTHAARKIGGTETYIEALLPALVRAGHHVAVVFEADADLSRPPIVIPSQVQCWSAQDHGAAVAAMRLVKWTPDVIYVNGVADTEFEARVQQIAPSVFYAHNFYGQCISGTKCYRRPRQTICTRRFGPACMTHFLARGCGGRNPIQMVRDYRRQLERLHLLERYARVLANSHYLASEYSRHGIHAECIPLFASKSPTHPPAIGECALPEKDEPWHLLFAGRAESLKGGHLLLKALPHLRKKIDRPILLTFAADGSHLPRWKQLANDIQDDGIQIEFAGWSTRAEELYSRSHLLVMPSIWPEPFGLTGIEAGSYAVPTVAFAAGGIPDWLHDDKNGHLAQADPPTAHKLAEALVRALSSREHYLHLRANALIRAREFTPARHINRLLAVFEQLVHNANSTERARVAAR